MGNTSTHYGLKKPSETEYYNIDDFNNNSDIVDSELNKNKVAIEEQGVKIEGVDSRVKTIENNISNPNLLVNSNFKVSELVNQRGKSVYNTPGYGFDRWMLANINMSVDLTGEYVKIKHANSSTDSIKILSEVIENYKEISNKTVTVSAEVMLTNGVQATIRLVVDGTIIHNKHIIGTGQKQKAMATFNVGVVSTRLEYHIILHTGKLTDELTIYNAKLEMGDIATNFIDDDPEIKLAKCLRHLVVLNNKNHNFLIFGNGECRNNTIANIEMNISRMRVNPALIHSGVNTLRLSNYIAGTYEYLVPTNIMLDYYDAKLGLLNFVVYTEGLTPGASTSLQFFNIDDSYLMLSAEM